MHFPKPNRSLLQLLGPSIVFVALALSGGEMLLWPDLIGKYGIGIQWLLPIVLLLQYAVNMEIERYTVTTGNNAVRGLIGIIRWLSPVFTVSIILSLVWPAWISTSGNVFAYTIGQEQYGSLFSLSFLLALLFVWSNKRSYSIMENISKIGLVAVLLISLYIIFGIFDFSSLPSIARDSQFFPDDIDRFTFVSALAYGGVTGVLNLVQSDWVTSKKYGLNQLDSNAENMTVDMSTDESKAHWKSWWGLITKEHFILYYIGNLFGMIVIGLVATQTLYGAGKEGFSVLTHQINVLNGIGFNLGILWGISATLLFAMAQVTILDAAGRLLKNSTNTTVSHEKLSQLVGVGGIGIVLTTIFVPGFNQPSLLLQISALMSALVMSLYPPLLLIMNRQLPRYARPKIHNYVLVIACSVFYAVMLIWGAASLL